MGSLISNIEGDIFSFLGQLSTIDSKSENKYKNLLLGLIFIKYADSKHNCTYQFTSQNLLIQEKTTNDTYLYFDVPGQVNNFIIVPLRIFSSETHSKNYQYQIRANISDYSEFIDSKFSFAK